ncbi:MAG: hypothetical protein Greene041619_271 [Candidatus Peregrinibacteria bacterium Greene0416_19]|nr:MAG: hypothetical protein Greene041619_271 [Candidatus Peregrinibacteria bacterium Greene0416_19]
MLTIAALPKPFIGHIGLIQRNSIQSWLQMTPRPQVILFGNEEGTAQVAAEFGLEHVPSVECNEYGTPYLRSVFAEAERRAVNDFICYSNCDIIIFPDFMPAFRRALELFHSFLLLAECVNLDVKKPVDFADVRWQEDLRRRMCEKGKRRANAADFFTFRKGMYPSFPPLILGRSYFDNWVIHETCRLAHPVIEATGQITAIHQNHYYAAAPGETIHSHAGFEAAENFRILRGWDNIYWLYDATHRMTAGGIHRSLIGSLHLINRWQRFRRWLRRSMVSLAARAGLRERPYYAE